jgi:hypothetical protein
MRCCYLLAELGARLAGVEVLEEAEDKLRTAFREGAVQVLSLGVIGLNGGSLGQWLRASGGAVDGKAGLGQGAADIASGFSGRAKD